MPCFSLRVRSSRSVHWTPQLSGWNTELCPKQWIWCRRSSFKVWIADGSAQANQIPSHILWEHGCWRRGFIEVMIRNKRTTLSAANQDLIKAVWLEWTNLVLFPQLRACQHFGKNVGVWIYRKSFVPSQRLFILFSAAAYIEVCRQGPVLHYQPLGSEQQVSTLNLLMETLWGSSG